MNKLKKLLILLAVPCFLTGCLKPINNKEYFDSKGEPKIFQDATKITFLEPSGNVKLEIPLANKTEIRKELIDGATVEIEYNISTKALKCDTSDYVAVVQNTSIANDDQDIGKTTFKYFSKAGELMFQKDGFDINCLYNSPNILSSDGKRILYTTKYDKNWISVFKASILNEKGEEIFDFGVFGDVHGQFITKNGKYGYFSYGKMEGSKSVVNDLFFDIDNNKTQIVERGINRISDDGKIKSFVYLEEIWVYNDGRIEFYNDKGSLSFEGYYDKLTKEQISMIAQNEMEVIMQLIGSKKEDHLIRKKVIREYQFK